MKVKILLLFAIFTLTSFIKAQDTTSTFPMYTRTKADQLCPKFETMRLDRKKNYR